MVTPVVETTAQDPPRLQMAAPAPAAALPMAQPPPVDVPVREGDARTSRRRPNLLGSAPTE